MTAAMLKGSQHSQENLCTGPMHSATLFSLGYCMLVLRSPHISTRASQNRYTLACLRPRLQGPFSGQQEPKVWHDSALRALAQKPPWAVSFLLLTPHLTLQSSLCQQREDSAMKSQGLVPGKKARWLCFHGHSCQEPSTWDPHLPLNSP